LETTGIPFTVKGVLSWDPLRVSFAGAVDVGFGAGLGKGFDAVGDGMGVADGVWTAGVVGAGTPTGTGEGSEPAVQPVRTSTAASASALLRQLTAGRAR
jgi:hypothetical protein